jgi:hypothetical protein
LEGAQRIARCDQIHAPREQTSQCPSPLLDRHDPVLNQLLKQQMFGSLDLLGKRQHRGAGQESLEPTHLEIAWHQYCGDIAVVKILVADHIKFANESASQPVPPPHPHSCIVCQTATP